MIPLYGFLQGDTIGLLILVDSLDTIEAVAGRLRQAASVRVAEDPRLRVVLHGTRRLDPTHTVAGSGLQPLDLIRVVREAA
jgi:hypothetical protein